MLNPLKEECNRTCVQERKQRLGQEKRLNTFGKEFGGIPFWPRPCSRVAVGHETKSAQDWQRRFQRKTTERESAFAFR